MIEYRIASEDDYQNINGFYNRVRSRTRTMDQFYWEFHNSPFGKSIYVLALDQEKIIGTNCIIPIELIDSHQRKISSGKSEDTLVDPQYRGQNVFKNIYDFLFEESRKKGVSVIWGFTPAYKPFKKIGFDIPVEQQQCLSVHDVFASYRYLSRLNPKNKVLDHFKILGLCIQSKAKQLFKPKPSIPRGYRVSSQRVSTEAQDIIHSNLKSIEGGFTINSTPSFLDWRVYSNPNYSDIRSFTFFDMDDLPKGVVIVNVPSNKVAYFCLDCFDSTLNDDDAISMIEYVKSELINSGIALIRNWVFGHNPVNQREMSLFKGASFTVISKGTGLVWKTLTDDRLDADNFILSRIATQGVT